MKTLACFILLLSSLAITFVMAGCGSKEDEVKVPLATQEELAKHKPSSVSPASGGAPTSPGAAAKPTTQ